jgi:hypothetical protein
MNDDGEQHDQLRALLDDPKLRALMERCYAARTPVDRQAALAVFVETADELYPDWRITEAEAEDDGRIPRAVTIHLVKRIRERVARGELDEFERFEAREAEAKYVVSFNKVMAPRNAAAAFRMQMAFWELMRLAKLDQEEMAEITRQARRDMAATGGSADRTEKDWVQRVLNAARRLFKEDPSMRSGTAARKIKERMGGLPDVRWVAQKIRDNRGADKTLPPRQLPPTPRPTRRR